MSVDYAVVIGIKDYTPEEQYGLRKLESAINDADSMDSWLVSPHGGKLERENCYKIVSSPNPLSPLQNQIDAALEEIVTKAMQQPGNNKKLYFYFSGHGIGIEENAVNNALCLANWSEIRRNSALSSFEYNEVFKRFGLFKEVIFIADCCRNTKVNIRPLPCTVGIPMAGQAAGATKYFFAFATQYQKDAYEVQMSEGDKRGIFTKVLLDGLHGEAANDRGEIDAESLKKYLDFHTPNEAQKAGYLQTPEITTNASVADNFIFNSITLPDTIRFKLRFSGVAIGQIDLFNGSTDIIKTLQVNGQREFDIDLLKGLYILRDQNGQKIEQFEINPSSPNQELDVTY